MFDVVFVTHLPAFYKVNLYNAIAQKKNIFVIFVSNASAIRTEDFIGTHCQFPHVFLTQTPFETRHKLNSCYTLFKILQKIQYQEIIVGGWDLIEFWVINFLSSRRKTSIAIESASESESAGIKGFLKKLFLRKISKAYVCGEAQSTLVKALGFQGEIIKTYGVGIFDLQQPILSTKAFKGRFLYVGRLAPEKNVEMMIEVMNQYPQYQLTIAGDGPLKASLQAIAKPHIQFLSHVPNQQIGALYQAHDVFILPSMAEPWGLVVEEALHYGLPVLASCNVGCVRDLVLAHQAGIEFDPLSKQSLMRAIETISIQKHYEKYRQGAKAMDFCVRDSQQVSAYLKETA